MAFFKLTVMFISQNTPNLRHLDQNIPTLCETNAWNIAIRTALSEKFEDGKINLCAFLSQKPSPAELNYHAIEHDMFVIVYGLSRWKHYVLGTEHKMTIFLNHQNLQYFTTNVKPNRRQVGWTESVKECNFIIMYHEGCHDQQADIVSRCPAYTF
jgi:hypothetical protein